MAVKKTTAKKSVAKKATAKKSAPKKAASRATSTKKATVKKTAPKKTTVKKRVVKKTAKKAVAKKAVTKKAVKRPAKKAVKKIASRRGVDSIVIPEAPIAAQRSTRVEIVSTPAPFSVASTPSTTPPPMPVSAEVRPAPEKKPGASGRVIFAVVVGIILLGLIVWAKGNNSNSNAKPTSTATPTTSATPTDSASPTPSASDTAATITAHEAPQGVVAHYTSTGATIFWKAPTAVDGLTGYNVEISVSNGPWKLISTLPAAQLSLDVKKVSTAGWTSFKVSSVYSDSQTSAAKAFGLPGTFS